jgi:hypothetical protein
MLPQGFWLICISHGAGPANGTTMVVAFFIFDEECIPLKIYYSYLEKTTVA